jgi:invasion protein IalB
MMRIGLKHLATLLGAAAVAAAMGAAPVAAAAPADAQQSDQPQQSCEQQGASQYVWQYVCEGPGNVQLNDPPSVTNYYSILG